jgi:hypothetical protein
MYRRFGGIRKQRMKEERKVGKGTNIGKENETL